MARVERRRPAARPAPDRRVLSRRTLLAGGAVAVGGITGVLVTEEVLPGRTVLFRTIGLGGADGEVPQVPAGPVLAGAYTSAARGGTRTEWRISLPPDTDPARPARPDGRPLPVCVLLHGRGGSARTLVDLGYDRFLTTAVRDGVPPFALVSIDGGERYWHRRADGEDPGRAVVDELLPMLAARGLAAGPQDRVALMGWSMGGYGALLLGSTLGAARVAAVVAQSPALWTSADDAAPGAFDDADDHRRHDVFARRDGLAGVPVRIDCGVADPFWAAARSYAHGLRPAPAGSFGLGDHDRGYWRRMARPALSFAGRALARR